MPNLEEHCRHTLKRLGVEGRDIHSWIDEPSRKYRQFHRQYRHDTQTVQIVGEIFGKKYGQERAQSIALDHIMADHEEDLKKTAVINSHYNYTAYTSGSLMPAIVLTVSGIFFTTFLSWMFYLPFTP
jgi:hypothetical protein